MAVGRTSQFNSIVKVRDLSREDSRWLNLYKKTNLISIFGLFERARKDGRPLRFLTRGPDARACMQALYDLLSTEDALTESNAIGALWEATAGIDQWDEARWRGVRQEAAKAEQGVYVDLSPIFMAIAGGGAISHDPSSWSRVEPLPTPQVLDVDALTAKLLRQWNS